MGTRPFIELCLPVRLFDVRRVIFTIHTCEISRGKKDINNTLISVNLRINVYSE